MKRLVKQAKGDLKKAKDKSERLEKRLVEKEESLAKYEDNEKERIELSDGKVKKAEDSRDLWKKKAEKLTDDIRDLKQAASSKPSTSEQLYLDQQRLEIKHNFEIRKGVHKQDMKELDDERKMKAKTKRYSNLSLYSGGGSGNGQWPNSILDGLVSYLLFILLPLWILRSNHKSTFPLYLW